MSDRNQMAAIIALTVVTVAAIAGVVTLARMGLGNDPSGVALVGLAGVAVGAVAGYIAPRG